VPVSVIGTVDSCSPRSTDRLDKVSGSNDGEGDADGLPDADGLIVGDSDADGLIDADGLRDALGDSDSELDGLRDADAELDGLIDGDTELDGLGEEISVTANVPDALKVCMVLLPLVVMVPPVAVMSAVE